MSKYEFPMFLELFAEALRDDEPMEWYMPLPNMRGGYEVVLFSIPSSYRVRDLAEKVVMEHLPNRDQAYGAALGIASTRIKFGGQPYAFESDEGAIQIARDALWLARMNGRQEPSYSALDALKRFFDNPISGQVGQDILRLAKEHSDELYQMGV